MAGKVAAGQPADFEYEVFDDSDHLRTAVATSNDTNAWIKPSALKLRHRIGRGPFGEVWLATHYLSTEDCDEYHEVAVKILHPVKEDRMRVLLERLNDLFLKCQGVEGICWLQGISVINGKISIIMKFYEGSVGDRMAQLKGGKLSLSNVFRYAIDLAQGILQLHSKGILVLNLKPFNFILNEADRAVLGDVGIPHLLLGIPLPSSDLPRRLGTPNYMAPEQWQPGASPPPSPPTSTPPSPPTAPPPSSPAVNSPPPQPSSPPPPLDAPPPPEVDPSPPSPAQPPPQALAPSPPPPANVPTTPSSSSPPPANVPTTPSSSSPPPANVPTTPSSSSPPPANVPATPSSSSPPPVNVPTPPSSSSPPPPSSNPPTSTPSPPVLTPPPHPSQSAPAPVTKSPPASTLSPPPPSVPSTSSPPAVSPPAPPSNSSTRGSPSTPPLPSVPTEKPTAKSTNGTTVSANASPRNAGVLGTGGAVAIGIAVGFLVLSLLVMAVWFAHKRKKKRAGEHIGYTLPSPHASSQKSDSVFLRPHSPAPLVGNGSNSGFSRSPSESGVLGNSRSWFTYDELIQATNGFSAHNVLGEGGFGCVYKGVLADGREVAVKQLKIGGSQGEREFRAEVEIISRVHHRHLVSLVGYCISERERLLVYEYVPNDTLHYHLHAEGRPVMDWATRVKVAAGAARGIAYLHEDCHPRIIHRDIKSSNILLDSSFEARVADFGLAKIALELDSNTHVSTRVMGTFGYMAPEYATSGKLTEKSDVYSFGVVLLELITGRKPVDASQPLGDESLVEWARPLLAEALEHEDFEALVDSRLEKNYVDSEMFWMIEAAAACVRHSATKRPRMSQVVRALDTLDGASDLTNGVKPGQSGIFSSAQHSAQIRMFQRLAFGGSQDYSSDFYNQSQTSWRSREYEDRSSYMP